MKELEFIKYIEKKFRVKPPIIKGIGDDCAVMNYNKNNYLLLTTDMIIEGTHFSRKTSGFQIGRKAMAVNISDIAAMGGIPKYALISAGVPRAKGMKFLKELTRGIESISRNFGITIIGGDTNSSPKTVLSITLLGEVEKKYLVKREGAKIGDFVFVTGVLGEGNKNHLSFLPRVREARMLVKNFKINSMIDLSDGLSMDLTRLAASSGVGAHIYESLIPLSEKLLSLRGHEVPEAIHSGEDFELLFTASPKESRKIAKRMGEDLPITLVGEIVKKRLGVCLIGKNGRAKRLKPKGFRHL